MLSVNSLYMLIRSDENRQSDLLYMPSMFAKSKIERMGIIPFWNSAATLYYMGEI